MICLFVSVVFTCLRLFCNILCVFVYSGFCMSVVLCFLCLVIFLTTRTRKVKNTKTQKVKKWTQNSKHQKLKQMKSQKIGKRTCNRKSKTRKVEKSNIFLCFIIFEFPNSIVFYCYTFPVVLLFCFSCFLLFLGIKFSINNDALSTNTPSGLPFSSRLIFPP